MKAHNRVASRAAGRTGVGLVLAATTVAAMTVPAGAASLPPAAQHHSVGATALALPTAAVAAPRSLPAAAPVAALPQRTAAMSTYRVRAGDTVSHIAARTGTSVAAIVSANNLNSRALIKVGQTLRIPAGVDRTPAASRNDASRSQTHTVVSGDTVSGLATRYGTTVAAIVSANNLNSRALILVGQRLTIPGSSSSTPSSAPSTGGSSSNGSSSGSSSSAGGTHVVRSGDTLSGLAARYGTSVSRIVQANGLRSSNLIYVGQRLTIPGASGSTGSPASTGGSSAGSGAGQQLVGNTFLGRTYARDVVSAANTNKATLLAMDVPSRDQMRAMVRETARSMGVDPALALAVAQQESGFDQRAVSPANAIGTMQVIPSSGDWASNLVGRELNLLDPRDNVVAGVAILRQLVRTADNFDQAVAGYYQGLAGVRRNGMYADTRNYVAGIKNLMQQY